MTEIRPAVAADIPQIQEVEIDAGQLFRQAGLNTIADDDPPDAETVAEHIAAGTAWVAAEGRVVAGYAVASVVDGEGHLDQVSVRRAFAGQGIGRRLIEQVARWAGEQGFEALTLTTFVDVPWNGPWYQRLGFQALTEASCGPQLQAIREEERLAGIEVAPRTAMRLVLAGLRPTGPLAPDPRPRAPRR